MIKKEHFKNVLKKLDFTISGDEFYKKFDNFDCELRVDFKKSKLIYPESNGLIINERQTCNFSDNENFVVFECVHRLITQGYNPKHIELEPKWQVGHGASGGRADILVKDNSGKSLLIIECKTAGSELTKAWETTQTKATQIFSYARQETSTQFIALYASDFIDDEVTNTYYLISLKDNEQLLKDNDKLKSYKSATSVEELYKVWSETYEKYYAPFGIFEKNRAYEIGKTKFSLEDLKNINSKDIQGKYHEFATILRQHNVSGRENAFDKLVSLFLCKVVDEAQNSDELKFYYKGRAYDSPYELQDRLQQLYKEGMGKFLGEDITYIDNQAIDDAFRVFKDKPNATKDVIKGYFKQLKFFTNNDFAFIDVHNEKLFHQNFEVLLKILKLFQDIRLTGSEENQFLGDMFEGFLDQGVKQSEGQFFTPMPIVKFIINSLPKKEKAKVIDYACGAGHFLNEYASVNNGSEIVGIEKEYRLSKVAKVSSFMYNQEIDIIYADALSKNAKVQRNSFDTLVANPPYSVKGFLETLSKEERENFELINSIDEKSYTANNAIECFFIERALQLLKSGGDAGIIVPSSILSKGSHKIKTKSKNVYVQTRELLLQHFHIVAIVEFGSGTFGKTGTNTVSLFLKRREQNPDIAEHFKNMINTWFSGDFSSNQAFKDESIFEEYLNHVSLDLDLYKVFLNGEINDVLQETEVFQEYLSSFHALSETKNRKKPRSYKEKTKEQKEAIESTEFLNYAKAIERDKFYYFSLAHKNECEVIIVKSPSDNKKNKQFLGYEWSGRKGDEGIKYIASQTVKVEEDDLEEDDKRVLENLQNLSNINTPLYNPKDQFDERKINTVIAKNFSGECIEIPGELDKFVSKAKLIDMLDFSRVEFDKAISLTPKRKIEIIGKPEWQVKLGDIVEVKIGGTPSRSNPEYFLGTNLWVSIAEMNGQVITDTKEKITDKGVEKSNVKLLPKGTTLLSFKLSIGKTAIAGEDLYTNEAIAGLVPKNKKVLNGYLFHLFNGKIIDLEKDGFNTFGKSLNSSFLKENVKIPLPPLDIQEKIIKACEMVNVEVEQAKEQINKLKSEIKKEISGVTGKKVKLSKVIDIIGGGTPKTSVSQYWNGDIPWLSVVDFNNDNRYVSTSEKTITQKGLDDSSTKLLQKGDLIISARGTVGAVAELAVPMAFNQSCYGLRPHNEIDRGFLYYMIIREVKQLKENAYGSTFDSITTRTFDSIIIPLPPLKDQKSLVERVEKLEKKIGIIKAILNKYFNKKEAILKRFL